MNATDFIDKIFALDDETAIDAQKTIFIRSDNREGHGARRAHILPPDAEFIRALAAWAAQKSGENADDVLATVKAKYGAPQISTLKDILATAAETEKSRRTNAVYTSTPKQHDARKANTLKIIIHRGTKQIGGSITEIAASDTHILVDCGANLPGSSSDINDNDIINLLRAKHFDGILFTHYHGDHVGLIDKIPADIPIYMDEIMLAILRVLHKHTGNKTMQELLANRDERIRTFTPGKLLNIGDMNVIPFFVDHSAYHANMFLFESKLTGHTVLHSGDFRSTGYMAKSLDIIPRLIRENYGKKTDVLLSEGTMLTRSVTDEHLLTERELQKEAQKFMKERHQIFVICSSTNFDSLTSVCQAANSNHLPVYGSDHIIEMLKTFSNMARKFTARYNLPQIKGISELKQVHPKKCVVLLGSLLNRKKEDAFSLYDRYGYYIGDYKPHLIYSMWKGYLDPKHSAYDEGLATFVKRFGSSVKYLHSTGHADRKTLAKFIEDMAPRKYIVPFHTEDAAGFKSLSVESKYKDMIILPNDGDTIEIA